MANELEEIIPGDPRAQAELAQRWSAILDFAPYDRPDEPGAWNLVYALRSIEESCKALLGLRLPNAVAASTAEDLRKELQEVGMELGHLLYHIRDARYLYSFVRPMDIAADENVMDR